MIKIVFISVPKSMHIIEYQIEGLCKYFYRVLQIGEKNNRASNKIVFRIIFQNGIET